MHENLLTYAKTFERNDDFKRDMEPPYGTASERGLFSTLHISWTYHSRGYEELNKNPFKCDFQQHPVELALEEASIASENNDAERFKNARAGILEYLEPQYRRITEAAASAVEFVKHQKVLPRLFCTWNTSGPLCRMLDDEPVNNHDACVDGILLLEKYDVSFRRDMPLETQREIRKRQRAFELAYAKLPRENFMRLASNELEIYEPHSQKHLEKFKSYFRSAMDDMDQQYLESRAARKALFEHDTANQRCELDLGPWRCDDMVDWVSMSLKLVLQK